MNRLTMPSRPRCFRRNLLLLLLLLCRPLLLSLFFLLFLVLFGFLLLLANPEHALKLFIWKLRYKSGRSFTL